jgi:hypothetical protein
MVAYRRQAATALFVMVCLAGEAFATERIDGAFHQVGTTAWTVDDDLVELARFPLKSDDPAYIVYLESLHPEFSDCSLEGEAAAECERPDLCHIWVAVREDLRPVRSEPIQPDPSRVLVAWQDEQTRNGNGEHMDAIWNFGLLIIGNDDQSLVFHPPITIRYAETNQQCMAAVRIEYAENFRSFFSRWPDSGR